MHSDVTARLRREESIHKSMRVAHVIGHFTEGLGYEENHLGFFQASLGAEVFIVTSTTFTGTWKGLQGLEHLQEGVKPGIRAERGVEIHRLKPWFHARGGTQIVLRRLKSTLETIKPDILHVHSPVGALTVQALMAAKALGLPVVVDCHLWNFHLHPFGIVKRAYYELFRRVLLPHYRPVIKRYVPLGPDPHGLLHSVLGIPNTLMSQSTLGADTTTFRFNEHARLGTRRLHGIPSDGNVILFVGRLDPGKEVAVLVEAWNQLAQKHDAYLMLVGPAAPTMVEHLARAAHPHIRERLIMTGFVPNSDLPSYMSAADIAVWPGDPGIAMNESMASSAVIVHSDEDAARHLTMYGNGEAFLRGNPYSLAGVLDSILSDPARLADMRLRSRRLAKDVYDWKVVAERTNRIYEDVLKGRDTSIKIWEDVI